MTLARAAMEPRWGAFVSRVDYVGAGAQLGLLDAVVTASPTRARRAGILRFANINAATDLIVGATIEATRRIVHGERAQLSYLWEVAAMCLAGLGMAPATVEPAVRSAWRHLASQGANLVWWQPQRIAA
jgi:hypothetical protein